MSEPLASVSYDVAIVGGGVNGCGVARDLAGRGASVLLVEKDDLASGTSSASTKLVHGGLRYLEHYEFGLVREALREREVLLRIAPHIVRPMRFVLPHHRGLRPAWLIRLGLFLYDMLGDRRALPGSRALDLSRDEAGRPLQQQYRRGFEYSDCWVDDARLVVLNAVDAARRGADVRVRTELVGALRSAGQWRLELRDTQSGDMSEVAAKILVNAAGPWVNTVMSGAVRLNAPTGVRLVKGSHIVVPRLFDHDRAYIFQNPDQRVIFAIPYQNDLTLIGTTDVDYEGDPRDANATQGEIEYLCDMANAYFAKPVGPDDVLWTYSGVRPLQDDGGDSAQEASRDYVLDVIGERDEAPLLNVVGGKITTYRYLAVEVAEKLKPWLPQAGGDWTHASPLPGGDFALSEYDAVFADLAGRFEFLNRQTLSRLFRAYGKRVVELLDGVTNTADLGQHFGADLYEREVAFLIASEWARTAEDVLWRRSKLGLRLRPEQREELAMWMQPARVQAELQGKLD